MRSGRIRSGARPPGAARREFAAGVARIVLFWEQVWPALLPVLAPAFLIVIASLFGLWRLVPAWAHTGVLGLAAASTIAAAYRYGRGLVWPSRRDALARLEGDGGLAHAPLQALEDRPFGASGPSPLWRAHVAAMKKKAAGARLKGPRASADERDPWSLRFAAPGLLLVALVAAGDERSIRLAEALHPGAALPGGLAVADLWIEPPAYTGKAPIYLLRAGDAIAGARAQVDAPAGSIVVAQANQGRGFALSFRTPTDETKGAKDEAAAGRITLALQESGLLRLRHGGAEGRWPIGAIPDHAPAARFIEEPSTTDDARLALAVAVEDDYGVAGATLKIRLDPDQERPLDSPVLDEASIRERRIVTLEGLGGKSGERRFDLDLQADPWAGLVVIASLAVTDGAGQTGETEEATFRLPARPFFNPLARVVVEQRQTLAVAPKDWRRAGRSFDALTLAPDRFYDRATDYLLMRTAFWRVMRQEKDGFQSAVEEFWPLALQLEDEALELAKRRLEAAQDALRSALERGAGEEEIARLVEELRDAMRGYLQALAESGQRMAEEEGPAGEMLNPGDLDEMLDAIRDLSQAGAQNAARQALSDLENILNNLRLSSRGGGKGSGQGEAGAGQGGAAGKAGDLIGRQRDLANRSFERGQSPGEPGDDLAAEEGGLAGDLSRLLDELKTGDGVDPDGKGAQALGEALQQMRDAESALNADNFDAAGTSMERAIASLREGAQALAEARAAAAQAGRNGETGPALDPLGRPMGDAYGAGVKVPEAWDAQRARDVLEELRRRLSDGKRSEDEINYLERLLERF